MTTGVYKIINRKTGDVYVGGSVDVERRKIEHFKPSRVKRLIHLPLYEAIDKYGKSEFDFEIIEVCSEDELIEKEEYYLSRLKEIGHYNVVYKALNMQDEDFSKDNGRRLSERNKRNWANPEYRKKMSESIKAYQATVTDEERTNAIAELNKYTDSIKLPVGQYDKDGNLIAVFDGVREAERAMGLGNDTIGKVCRGEKYRKTAGGYIWKYLDE